MRISDWSSDVCSSDLIIGKRRPRIQPRRHDHRRGGLDHQFLLIVDRGDAQRIALPLPRPDDDERAIVDVVVLLALATEHEIGRASCLASVCQYGSISVVDVTFKKKKEHTITNKL